MLTVLTVQCTCTHAFKHRQSYSQLSSSREQFCVSRGNLLKSIEQRAVTVILQFTIQCSLNKSENETETKETENVPLKWRHVILCLAKHQIIETIEINWSENWSSMLMNWFRHTWPFTQAYTCWYFLEKKIVQLFRSI